MKITKNRKGQTDSVFKLALVVIIIAAVLAVVAYMMGSVWSGTTAVVEGTQGAADEVGTNTDCLVLGNCGDVGPTG